MLATETPSAGWIWGSLPSSLPKREGEGLPSVWTSCYRAINVETESWGASESQRLGSHAPERVLEPCSKPCPCLSFLCMAPSGAPPPTLSPPPRLPVAGRCSALRCAGTEDRRNPPAPSPAIQRLRLLHEQIQRRRDALGPPHSQLLPRTGKEDEGWFLGFWMEQQEGDDGTERPGFGRRRAAVRALLGEP